MEGSGHTAGGVLDAELSALAMLGRDGFDVIEDGGGQIVNVLLGSICADDEGSLDGNGGTSSVCPS